MDLWHKLSKIAYSIKYLRLVPRCRISHSQHHRHKIWMIQENRNVCRIWAVCIRWSCILIQYDVWCLMINVLDFVSAAILEESTSVNCICPWTFIRSLYIHACVFICLYYTKVYIRHLMTICFKLISENTIIVGNNNFRKKSSPSLIFHEVIE